MLTKKDIKEQLKEMGIKQDDTVMIHTSLRAVGPVENGADGLIDAFKEYLKEGLLLVPTHTWNTVGKDNPVYDARSSVPCTGTLPKIAAFRKDGVRSLHPTHSVWACGKNAEEYVRGEEKAVSPAGPGFCWSKLGDVGAKILLIGVENNRNTFIHSIDELAELPDRIGRERFATTLIDAEGNTIHGEMAPHLCSKTPDVSQFYVNFEKPLVRLGAQTLGKLGSAEVRVVDAAKCRDIIMRIYSRAKEDIFTDFIEIPEELYL